jgi:outer membrane protein assembly factor BamB
MCLNWRTYDSDNYKTNDPKMIFWHKMIPGALRGRSFVTADSVYVPLQKKLVRVNLKTGKSDAEYPSDDRAWDESESAGNILVTPDHLIIAGSERVNVYTDLNLAMAKLDKEVEATPDDPEARLRYAEVMFVAGKFDVAVEKLDEAIKVIGGLEKTTDSGARDRIYACAMAFAEKLARDKDDANNEQAAGLYDRAAQAASSAQQQVNYRISRAKFAEDQKDDTTELKLLQEILAEPTWRSVPVVQAEAGGPAQAAAVAEKSIAELITRSPDTYAPINTEAETAFDKATADGANPEPATLLSIAQQYPNSNVAPKALLKAADAYEAASNPRQAVQLLRQLYFKYPLDSNRALVIESLARNYLATPNHVDVAIARLAQGAKLPGDPKLTKPLVLPDGTTIKDCSIAQAVEQLRKYHEQATTKALPDFNLPTKVLAKPFIAAVDPVAKGVASIVAPLKDCSRNDRIVTFALTTGVSVWAVGSNEPIFSSKAIVEIPRNCAWIGDTLVVWSPSKIAMFKGDSASPMWETELKSIPVVEVATRDESGEGNASPDDEVVNFGGPNVRIMVQGRQRVIVRGNGMIRMPGRPQRINNVNNVAVPAGAEQIWKVAIVSDRIIVTTTGGRIIALDPNDGKTIWQMRPSDKGADRLLASDDFVVCQFSDGSQIRVVALDTFSGQNVSHREFPADGSGVVNMALSSDGKLVYLMLDRVEVKDLFEPGDKMAFTVRVTQADGVGAFAGAIEPDQLLISEGRIIAVCQDGRFLRIYSLENGKTLHGPQGPEGTDTAVGLQTKAAEWKIGLAAVGSRVYAIGERTIKAYNLDNLSDSWDGSLINDTKRDWIMGKDYLLLITEPVSSRRVRVAPQFPTALTVAPFSRLVLPNGTESGVEPFAHLIKSPAGIQTWQGVEGGMYYLTGDQKLYFLKGSGRE